VIIYRLVQQRKFLLNIRRINESVFIFLEAAAKTTAVMFDLLGATFKTDAVSNPFFDHT
jgi:hypothetical protein